MKNTIDFNMRKHTFYFYVMKNILDLNINTLDLNMMKNTLDFNMRKNTRFQYEEKYY